MKCNRESVAQARCLPVSTGMRLDIMTLAKGLARTADRSGCGQENHHATVEARRAWQHLWWQSALLRGPGHTDLVEREYAANAEKVGAYFMTRLRELQSRHPVIGEVRGKGLMIGMELVSDRASREPAKELCHAVITCAFHQGLLLLSVGRARCVSCRR